MERGSFNGRFDNAQWKLAEHAVWANTWEQEAAHGCPKGQTSRFEGGPVALISLRRRYRAAKQYHDWVVSQFESYDLRSRARPPGSTITVGPIRAGPRAR
jgi:hypothetical protein